MKLPGTREEPKVYLTPDLAWSVLFVISHGETAHTKHNIVCTVAAFVTFSTVISDIGRDLGCHMGGKIIGEVQNTMNTVIGKSEELESSLDGFKQDVQASHRHTVSQVEEFVSDQKGMMDALHA